MRLFQAAAVLLLLISSAAGAADSYQERKALDEKEASRWTIVSVERDGAKCREGEACEPKSENVREELFTLRRSDAEGFVSLMVTGLGSDAVRQQFLAVTGGECVSGTRGMSSAVYRDCVHDGKKYVLSERPYRYPGEQKDVGRILTLFPADVTDSALSLIIVQTAKSSMIKPEPQYLLVVLCAGFLLAFFIVMKLSIKSHSKRRTLEQQGGAASEEKSSS